MVCLTESRNWAVTIKLWNDLRRSDNVAPQYKLFAWMVNWSEVQPFEKVLQEHLNFGLFVFDLFFLYPIGWFEVHNF